MEDTETNRGDQVGGGPTDHPQTNKLIKPKPNKSLIQNGTEEINLITCIPMSDILPDLNFPNLKTSFRCKKIKIIPNLHS